MSFLFAKWQTSVTLGVLFLVVNGFQACAQHYSFQAGPQEKVAGFGNVDVIDPVSQIDNQLPVVAPSVPAPGPNAVVPPSVVSQPGISAPMPPPVVSQPGLPVVNNDIPMPTRSPAPSPIIKRQPDSDSDDDHSCRHGDSESDHDDDDHHRQVVDIDHDDCMDVDKIHVRDRAKVIFSATGHGHVDAVIVCHVPPGNPSKAHDVVVPLSAVGSHKLHHGDHLGPCGAEIVAKCE